MILTRDEFYRLARDRSRRYLRGDFFTTAQIGLTASRYTAQTYSGQVLILSTANLISRSCPRATLAIPDAPLHPYLVRPGVTTLWERLRFEMYGANPYGDYEIGGAISNDVDYVLQLGRGEGDIATLDLTADGDGWMAYVGRRSASPFLEHKGLNPIGPVAAACLAVADLFKVIANVPEHLRVTQRILSLFDYTLGDSLPATLTVPENVDLGAAQMVGVGSVGSAVLYLLSLLPVRGHLDLIEPQNVEWENLDRSSIFMVEDVGRPKVEVGAKWIAGHTLQIHSHRMTYADFVRVHGRAIGRLDVVLLLANEDNVYADFQNNFPPLVVYGTTTSGWGVNLGRHIPLREECVLCRYPNHLTPMFECSTAEVVVPQNGERIDASLPFLSLMAGTLAVAELLKAQLNGYPFHGNFVYMDFKGPLTRIQVTQRDKQRGCICSRQSQTVYQNVIAGSRRAGLSLP